MTYPAWPASIAAPERESLVCKPLDGLARRRCQSGRTEVRRFGAGVPALVEAEVIVPAADLDDWVAFYEEDCACGALWFTADWIEDIGYTASHVGRFYGYPRSTGDTFRRCVRCAFLIQHTDNLSWT